MKTQKPDKKNKTDQIKTHQLSTTNWHTLFPPPYPPETTQRYTGDSFDWSTLGSNEKPQEVCAFQTLYSK